jgi:hypothetical protein
MIGSKSDIHELDIIDGGHIFKIKGSQLWHKYDHKLDIIKDQNKKLCKDENVSFLFLRTKIHLRQKKKLKYTIYL